MSLPSSNGEDNSEILRTGADSGSSGGQSRDAEYLHDKSLETKWSRRVNQTAARLLRGMCLPHLLNTNAGHASGVDIPWLADQLQVQVAKQGGARGVAIKWLKDVKSAFEHPQFLRDLSEVYLAEFDELFSAHAQPRSLRRVRAALNGMVIGTKDIAVVTAFPSLHGTMCQGTGRGYLKVSGSAAEVLQELARLVVLYGPFLFQTSRDKFGHADDVSLRKSCTDMSPAVRTALMLVARAMLAVEKEAVEKEAASDESDDESVASESIDHAPSGRAGSADAGEAPHAGGGVGCDSGGGGRNSGGSSSGTSGGARSGGGRARTAGSGAADEGVRSDRRAGRQVRTRAPRAFASHRMTITVLRMFEAFVGASEASQELYEMANGSGSDRQHFNRQRFYGDPYAALSRMVNNPAFKPEPRWKDMDLDDLDLAPQDQYMLQGGPDAKMVWRKFRAAVNKAMFKFSRSGQNDPDPAVMLECDDGPDNAHCSASPRPAAEAHPDSAANGAAAGATDGDVAGPSTSYADYAEGGSMHTARRGVASFCQNTEFEDVAIYYVMRALTGEDASDSAVPERARQLLDQRVSVNRVVGADVDVDVDADSDILQTPTPPSKKKRRRSGKDTDGTEKAELITAVLEVIKDTKKSDAKHRQLEQIRSTAAAISELSALGEAGVGMVEKLKDTLRHLTETYECA